MPIYSFICMGLILITTYAEGALPPAWQNVAEIKAILNNPELSHVLDSADLIESISKTEEGWKIITNHGEIAVKINPIPQAMPGPEQFTLEFSKSQSLQPHH